VISDNIFEINPEMIKDTHVVMTIIDGKVVYSTN